MGVKSNKKLKSVNLGDSWSQELPVPDMNSRKGSRNCAKSYHYQTDMNNFQMLLSSFLGILSIITFGYDRQIKMQSSQFVMITNAGTDDITNSGTGKTTLTSSRFLTNFQL